MMGCVTLVRSAVLDKGGGAGVLHALHVGEGLFAHHLYTYEPSLNSSKIKGS